MVERLVIDRLGHRGDGVTSGAGAAIYVPGTLPGETVEVEAVAGHPDRRQLLRVDTPSAERIAPICAHFGVCGGCAVQHWEVERYRAWKHDLVVAALRQAGLDAPVAELVDAHGEGRRRAVFHARRGTHDVIEVGFSAARAHQLVAIDRCPILQKDLTVPSTLPGQSRKRLVRPESRWTSMSPRPTSGSTSTCVARAR